jgi:diacylglycerol kinase (ATP)
MTIEDSARKVRGLGRSFLYSIEGVNYCIKNERNMRIHLIVASYVLAFSLFYNLTSFEYAVLFIVIGLVLAAEAVNTAIESIVNLNIECYNKLARIAKNVAAGAVFICAISATAVGGALFLNISTIQYIIRFLYTNYLYGILFIISIPISLFFIFRFPFKSTIIRRIKIGR